MSILKKCYPTTCKAFRHIDAIKEIIDDMLKTDTQEVHPRNLNFMKLQVSQDTNVELSSEEEKNSDILKKKTGF